MEPHYFRNQEEFRLWLASNHNKASELIVGFYKKGSGKQNMTWSESVDQALCYGWIDGITRSVDSERYSIRFTPRKEKSIWSSINIKKVSLLKKAGLMEASGLAAYEKRTLEKSEIYVHENEAKELDAPFVNLFKKNKKGWKYFNLKPASYQKTAIYNVMSAKQEITRKKRLDELIKASAENVYIKSLRRKS